MSHALSSPSSSKSPLDTFSSLRPFLFPQPRPDLFSLNLIFVSTGRTFLWLTLYAVGVLAVCFYGLSYHDAYLGLSYVRRWFFSALGSFPRSNGYLCAFHRDETYRISPWLVTFFLSLLAVTFEGFFRLTQLQLWPGSEILSFVCMLICHILVPYFVRD